MNLPEQRSDDDLAVSLAMGDASASATLAQRFAPGLYDFALRVSLDPAAAEQATETTLNRLGSEIGSRPDGLGVKAWLYGIARDEALESMRQRVRNPGSRDEPQAGALAPMDSRFVETNGAFSADAAAWAWGSARGQRPRDYSILDLLLRRKITPEEVADIGSLSRNGVYGVIGRLRGAFEESFISAALYSSGRRNCADLAGLIDEAPSLGPALRREISRHAETCADCRATRENLPAAADVFAALETIEIPDGLADRLLPLMLAAMPDFETAEAAATQDDDLIAEEEEHGTETDVLASAGAVAAAAALAAAAAAQAEEANDAELGNAPLLEETPTDAEQASFFEEDHAAEDEAEDLSEPQAPVLQPEVETLLSPPDHVVEYEPAVDDAATSLDQPTELPEELSDTGYDAETVLASRNEPEAEEDLIEESEDSGADEAQIAARAASGVAAAAYADEPDPDEYDSAAESAEEYPAAAAPEAPEAAVEEEAPATIFARRGPEPSAERLTPSRAGVAAGAGVAVNAAALQRLRESMQGAKAAGAAGGGGTGSPFGRATTYDGRNNRRKYLIYAAALVATLAALYVGVAVGDSLQSGGGGGDDGGSSGLPTRVAGITEANCPGPINLNQGSKVSLMFNDAPSGYSLDGSPGIRPISPTAAVPQVEAISQEGNSILFTANQVPNSAGRTDEYRLTATFSKGSDRQQKECTVRVVGPVATPMPAIATPAPAPPTSSPVPATATSVPIIVQPTAVQPTAVPPTQAPPTATPDLSTPTPSVPTVVPTAGGVLISPTERPSTATPVPPATSTLTPID